MNESLISRPLLAELVGGPPGSMSVLSSLCPSLLELVERTYLSEVTA